MEKTILEDERLKRRRRAGAGAPVWCRGEPASRLGRDQEVRPNACTMRQVGEPASAKWDLRGGTWDLSPTLVPHGPPNVWRTRMKSGCRLVVSVPPWPGRLSRGQLSMWSPKLVSHVVTTPRGMAHGRGPRLAPGLLRARG